MKWVCSVVLCTICLTATSNRVAAQPGPLEPSDTSSPEATLASFLSACNEFHALAEDGKTGAEPDIRMLSATERMLDCLDLTGLPEELRDSSGLEAAVFLKEVLDRIDVSADPVLMNPDADSAKTELQYRIAGTRLTISRCSSGPTQGQYLFSTATVRRAARFYSAARSLPLRSTGPAVSAGLRDRYLALTKTQPRLSADTSSPRGTLTLFLNTAEEIYAITQSEEGLDRNDPKFLPVTMQLISCLDTSDLPEYSRQHFAAEAAVCLKEVLDRLPLPPPEQIPGPEDVENSEVAEPLLRWQIPGTQLTIGRITDGPRRGEYVFTAGTVARVMMLFEKSDTQPYRDDRPVSVGFYDWYMTAPGNPAVDRIVGWLPGWFRQRMGGLAIWQWCGLMVTAVLATGLIMGLYRAGRYFAPHSQPTGIWSIWWSLLFSLLGIGVPLLFIHVAADYLTIRGTALYVVEFIGNMVFLIAVIVAVLGISRRLADTAIALPNIAERGLDAHLIRLVCQVLGIVSATIVFLEGGRYLGLPVTTLLASAGIGGLAVALSAQGMIKGLFGTLTLLLDRPFRVGERIVVNGHDGFVEEIGLRSTRLRTFHTNHLVSIPNDQMADVEIVNIGRRNSIRRMWDLRIPIDTPRGRVETAVQEIRRILKDHKGMDPAHPPRVHFNRFEPDAFNIQVIFWYGPPVLWEFEAFSESVNLEILQAFEDHGIQLSLPARHTFWKEDDQQGPFDVRILNGHDTKKGAAGESVADDASA